MCTCMYTRAVPKDANMYIHGNSFARFPLEFHSTQIHATQFSTSPATQTEVVCVCVCECAFPRCAPGFFKITSAIVPKPWAPNRAPKSAWAVLGRRWGDALSACSPNACTLGHKVPESAPWRPDS